MTNLQNETVRHEVDHPWRGSETAASCTIVQHNLIPIREGTRPRTKSERTAPNPHARVVHNIDSALARLLLADEHLGKVGNDPAQRDAEKGL